MWVLGGVVAICGALTFAHLGALYPREGGWFVYLREAWGPFPAFLFAWIVLFVISTGALAVMAKFCAGMILTTLGTENESLRMSLELGLPILLTLLALGGMKTSAWVQNAFMLLKLGAIGTFVGAGLLLGPAIPVYPAGWGTSVVVYRQYPVDCLWRYCQTTILPPQATHGFFHARLRLLKRDKPVRITWGGSYGFQIAESGYYVIFQLEIAPNVAYTIVKR